MKIITSVTVFNDAVGMRMSATYTEVDDDTGRILSDNKRFDRVITGQSVVKNANALMEYATANVPE